MRSRMLEQLYNGNIGAAHMPPYETELSQYCADQGYKLETQVEEKLDEQGRRLLGQLQEMKNGEDRALAYGCFIHGFKLATQIMVEVFANPESEVLNKGQYRNSEVQLWGDDPDAAGEIE